MEDFGETVASWMAQGGPVMRPLLGFSIVAMAVIVERFISLLCTRINANKRPRS